MTISGRLQAWLVAEGYAATIGELRGWWDSNARHGCFCGAGAGCDTPVDGLDQCCKQHDDDYGAVGHSFQTMWNIPEGFTETRAADAALVACAGGAQTDNAEFREHLITMFQTRVNIADVLSGWLERAGQIQDGLDRFRDWLQDAVSQADLADEAAKATVQEGISSHTSYLRQLGAADDEIAAVATPITPGDSGLQLA